MCKITLKQYSDFANNHPRLRSKVTIFIRHFYNTTHTFRLGAWVPSAHKALGVALQDPTLGVPSPEGHWVHCGRHGSSRRSGRCGRDAPSADGGGRGPEQTGSRTGSGAGDVIVVVVVVVANVLQGHADVGGAAA